MRGKVAAAALATILLVGCGSEAPSPDGARAEMADILDRAARAASAEPLGPTVRYTPEDLFEYINGMAAYFVDSGFERLAHAELVADGADGYVEVDLYDMGRPEGALDVLCDARTEDTAYLPLGDEAHDEGRQIEFRAGRYYVKVVGRRGAGPDRVREVAEAVAGAAPAGPTDDALLAPLPTEGRAPRTAAYTTIGFLGRSFLEGVYEASYETQAGPVRLFHLAAESAPAAETLARRWRASAPAESPQPLEGAADTFAYDEPYVGRVHVARVGCRLVGAIGPTDAARPLLDNFLTRVAEEAP